jgi:hypothetical protein
MEHLRLHVEAKGHKLIVNSTKTIFYITINDVVQRVQYAQHMMDILKTQPLDMIIFADETTLEESPHPKGMTIHIDTHALWQLMHGMQCMTRHTFHAAKMSHAHASLLVNQCNDTPCK